MRHARLRRPGAGLLAVALAAGLFAALPATAAPAAEPVAGLVLFEGKPIDLATSWGEAKACVVWNEAGLRECFRTEKEMDARVAVIVARRHRTSSPAPTTPAQTMSSQCSSSAWMYADTGYSGSVLYLRDRGIWLNLSNYGFANRTSSYKIGACSSYLADYSNGGGSWYPTSATQAWDQSWAMNSGWDDRVSSVYIT